MHLIIFLDILNTHFCRLDILSIVIQSIVECPFHIEIECAVNGGIYTLLIENKVMIPYKVSIVAKFIPVCS